MGIREDFEMGTGDGAKFAQNVRQIRAIARARCDMRGLRAGDSEAGRAVIS